MQMAWDWDSHARYVQWTLSQSPALAISVITKTQTWPRGQNHLCCDEETGIANHCSDQVLWLCSVVRSVFVQPIANYPLLIAENSYKISERSQLWNSDRFFANNNKLIGSCWLSRNGRKIIPVWQSQENIYKAFLIIIAISWFPRFPRSGCYQLLVSDKYISVSIPVTLFNVCWAPYLTIVSR